MATNFITNTASLKTTIADVRKLNAKKIFLGGEDILDIIKSSSSPSSPSATTIKHANDTRETVTENDLWGQWIETTSDGTIVVHDDEVVNPNASNSSAWDTSIAIVEDNKAYVGEEGDIFFANVQTEKIKNGYYMFYGSSALTSFSSDLPRLTDGTKMFFRSALTSFFSNLSSLMEGYYMFGYCPNLTSFNIDLPILTNAGGMFANCSNLTSFTSDSSGSPVNLSNLTDGNYMFYYCGNLKLFSADLSSLINGSTMFRNCQQLTSFYSNLPSLTNGESMFYNCQQLTSFNTNLPSMTDGRYMFQKCSNLTSFNTNLPSVTEGNYMFRDCSALTSFNIDLPSLINGYQMFYQNSNLTSFSSNLSSLMRGSDMFYKCKLDAKSVMYIADSIKDIVAEKQLYINGTIPYVTYDSMTIKYSAPRGFMSDGKYVYSYNKPKPTTETISASYVGQLTLGINVTNDANTIQQQLEDFAKEATFDSWADLKQLFVDKGWTVTFQYGGTSTNITYGLRDGEQIIPCQIFAKLIEADKDSAEYCTEDASTFYNIEWGHDVTDTSSYNQFDSLEDAMASWNVFPKENIITSEE